MLSRRRSAAAASTALIALLALAPSAHAQEAFNPFSWFGVAGGYMRADFGYSWSRKLTGGDNGLGGAFGDSAGRSYVGQVGFGGFIDPLRIDITGAYRGSYKYDAGGRGAVGRLAAPTSARATVDNYTVMVNAYFDIPTESIQNMLFGTGARPYIGAGIGWSRNIIGTRYFSNATGSGFERGARNSDLAWAVMAGVAVDITRNVAIDIGYRYIDFGKLRTSGQTTLGTFARSEANFRAHEALIGLRFSFAEPTRAIRTAQQTETTTTQTQTPPPQPQAQPERQPTYVVFFDFDRSAVTNEGQQVIRRAAEAMQSGSPVRIVVTGHADRSGSSDYNLRLSQRRADAVRAELQRAGIANAQITTRGRGEDEPLVQTPDGVREPQNRRAEIVME
jgi:outer membrane protein OmpA-like peptidoglycan-associated protein